MQHLYFTMMIGFIFLIGNTVTAYTQNTCSIGCTTPHTNRIFSFSMQRISRSEIENHVVERWEYLLTMLTPNYQPISYMMVQYNYMHGSFIVRSICQQVSDPLQCGGFLILVHLTNDTQITNKIFNVLDEPIGCVVIDY
jgi:hypothetical protein